MLGLSQNDCLSLRGAYTHVIRYDFFSLPNEAPDLFGRRYYTGIRLKL